MEVATLYRGRSLSLLDMGKSVLSARQALAQNLVKLMSARQIKDRAFGEQLAKTVNNMRHNKHAPELDSVQAVADFLRVPAWVLLTPNLPDEFFRDGTFNDFLENYISADPSVRESIRTLARAAAQTAPQAKTA